MYCSLFIEYIELKRTIKDLTCPFTEEYLSDFSNECNKLSKKIKKIQFNDVKFRTIQAMANMMIKNKFLNICFKITKYERKFLNIIVTNVNQFTIQMSLTYMLEINEYKEDSNRTHKLKITKINIPGKFDRGCIPELEDYLNTLYGIINSDE